MKEEVEAIFEKLHSWRNLPAFKLEPCVAPFIGYFLPTILKQVDEGGVCLPIIPEFPLKNENNNESKRLDYFALSKDRSIAYFVELKTDNQSENDEQIEYYLSTASERTLHSLIKDVKLISEVTEEKGKYSHLLCELSELGLIVDAQANCEKNVKIKVIFIVPDEQKFKAEIKKPKLRAQLEQAEFDSNFISFQDVACMLESHSELGKILSDYLRKWKDPLSS